MDGAQIGPSIPQHILEKRKRKAEEELAKKASVPTEAEKKKRIAGPAPPPAPLDERPSHDPKPAAEDASDSSDDDFGPPLPPSGSAAEDEERAALRRLARFRDLESAAREDDKKPKRDEWMIVPPKSEDWASKVDPTKIKNRKFNTGKGAKAPQKAGSGNTLWTETPEEKRKRLEDEVMGVKKPAIEGGETKTLVNSAEAEETARRIKEYNEKNRSKTLYAEHKQRAKYVEDDPSKRAFDREKDIAGGIKIGNKQKKEMLDRAADFGSRFSSGSYL